jgi:hypothetical protein
VKIRSVCSDVRRRAFAVTTARGVHEFPWTQLDVLPSIADPVVEVASDPELGGEGFMYRLASGIEGTVHIDHVLRFLRDPEYQRNQLLYALTSEAIASFAASGRTKRGIARQLGTSLPQIARLLDPANTRKSMDQLVRLLAALGRRVDLHFGALQPTCDRALDRAAEQRGISGKRRDG